MPVAIPLVSKDSLRDMNVTVPFFPAIVFTRYLARIGWRISQSQNTVNIDYVIVYVQKVDVRCRPLLQSSYDLHAELAGSGGGSGADRSPAGDCVSGAAQRHEERRRSWAKPVHTAGGDAGRRFVPFLNEEV